MRHKSRASKKLGDTQKQLDTQGLQIAKILAPLWAIAVAEHDGI